MNRWAIYIDIEGFSAIYRKGKRRAISALGELMGALYDVGTSPFCHTSERLFIHQFGDGFVVVSDFAEEKADRPLALCLAVMRHLLFCGIVTKAAISGGDFGDFSSCYPKRVMAAATKGRYVKIGDGIMTILPVMGSALISAHKLTKQQKGAVLLYDALMFASLPNGVKVGHGTSVAIDWIHSDFALVDEICEKAGLTKVDVPTAENKLKEYIEKNRTDLPLEWISSTWSCSNML